MLRGWGYIFPALGPKQAKARAYFNLDNEVNGGSADTKTTRWYLIIHLIILFELMDNLLNSSFVQNLLSLLGTNTQSETKRAPTLELCVLPEVNGFDVYRILENSKRKAENFHLYFQLPT